MNRAMALLQKRYQQLNPELYNFLMFGTPGTAPVLSSLNPNTKVVGQPNFTVHCIGTGFESGCFILWNGSPEPTTFVSSTDVSTGVNMATVSGAAVVPVKVRNPDNGTSGSVNFTFTAT